MILKTSAGNRELRDLFAGSDRIPRPSEFGGYSSWTGKRVGVDDAIGLPAVLAAIRLLSQTVGKLPLKVYRDRDEARSTPQWALLHEKPNDIQTPFGFWSGLSTSLETYGNAYILKTKSRGRVEELYQLDPARMKVEVENGALRYEYRDQSGRLTILTRAELIHVVGPFTLPECPYMGISPIAAARHALGFAIGLEEFGARFFENDATPGVVINHPGSPTEIQRKEMKDSFESRHRGASNSHKAAIMWGGATLERLSVTPVDSQWIEARQLSLQDVARIFGVPSSKLGVSSEGPAEDPVKENRRFVEDALQPRFTCIEQSFWADDDLFPSKSLKPEFVADALLRADTTARYAAYLPARQAGWLTPNEIRAFENLPPVEGGDEIQMTPVGGAPNEPTPEQERHLELLGIIARQEPPQVTVNQGETHVDARTRIEPGAVQVNEAETKIDARTTVEPTSVNVEQPDITVQAPEVRFEDGAIQTHVDARERSKRVVRDKDGNMVEIRVED